MTKAIYRPILKNAWKITWHHKRLWMLGIFAGLLNTGSVLNVLIGAFKRPSAPPANHILEWLFRESVPGVKTLTLLIQKTILVSQDRLVWLLCLLTIVLFILLYLATSGQDALIRILSKTKMTEKTGIRELFRHGHEILWHLFTVNILGKLALSALLAGSTLLFVNLASEQLLLNLLGNVAVLLFFIPLVLLVGGISMLAIIETSTRETPVFKSIKTSAQMTWKHFLPITEMIILLFLINLGFSIIAVIALLLASVPYLILTASILVIHSGALWIGAMLAGAVILFVIILSFFGFATVFTYATWIELYKRMQQKNGILSKVERLIKHFR